MAKRKSKPKAKTAPKQAISADSTRREPSSKRADSAKDGIETAAGPAASSSDKVDAADECVVVGIGASAGGLAAFKTLLRSAPHDGGVAYVLVQHLDPTHESLMAELLAKYTAMPVKQVNGKTRIEPDHVYMIPPNKFIRIKDGELLLDRPVKKRGIRMPIDYFFYSLAEARRERSVCIVLSGTGSDGAAGARAVKAEGGMTIVQDPSTAEYDGMPRAAMSTGAVDFVLPIDEMPEVFLPYTQHPYVIEADRPSLAERAPDYYRAILGLLHAHTDHDFSKYKNGTLTRRIERRMGIRHMKSPSDYLSLLREDSNELHALFKDMLIGVTQFFRDAKMWEELSDALTTRLLEKRDDEPFRVWVPGCSTGEEPYTLAMMLYDLQERQNRRLDLQIFATDIDRDAIDVARAGSYSESVAKDLPDRYLEMYFHREGERLRVKKRLRESCIFAVQNLLSDPPFSGLDVICCRNLLIYLEAEVQTHLFDMFHFALKPEGLLVLGSSESLGRRKKMFAAVSQSSRIFRKVGDSKHAPGRFAIPSGFANTPANQERRDQRETSHPAVSELSQQALLQEYAPPSVIVDNRGSIEFIHGAVRDYLDFPVGEPKLDISSIAVEGLKKKLRAAFTQCKTQGEPVSVLAPRVNRNGGWVKVRVRAQPLSLSKAVGPLYLISFIDESPPTKQLPDVPADALRNTDVELESLGFDEATDLRQLAIELQATREDLQSTIEELESANEELKASNEEVMSMNEELQSTNEELETSREELQSINEELSTVNSQLHDKVDELESTTNDLSNLLTSTDMATLFLDNNLRIRRYTPATTRVMNILDSDIGRPIDDLSPRVKDPELITDARSVLSNLSPLEREIDNGPESFYSRRITPFRTTDNKIEGVVITFADITRVTMAAKVCEDRERQQAVIAQLGRSALAGANLKTLLVYRVANR